MLNTYLMDLVQTGRVWLMTHEQSSCNKVLRWGLLMRQNLTGPWAGWSEGRTVGQIRQKNSKDFFYVSLHSWLLWRLVGRLVWSLVGHFRVHEFLEACIVFR